MREITTTQDISASPSQVWDVLTDFASHQRWNPFFARVEGSAVVGTSLKIKARKDDGSEGIGFTPKVLEADPGLILRWKGQLLIPGLFDGEHYFRLEELDDGSTRLHHGERFTGILIPFMGKVLADTEEGFKALNQALADEVHSRGEAPNPGASGSGSLGADCSE